MECAARTSADNAKTKAVIGSRHLRLRESGRSGRQEKFASGWHTARVYHSEKLRSISNCRRTAFSWASAGFAKNERMSRFLRFVLESRLEGRDADLKESIIALEVFGNRDYDPKQDSIVRTEASRLRSRLSEYYAAISGAAVIIELPKGAYVPVFRHLDSLPAVLFPNPLLRTPSHHPR